MFFAVYVAFFLQQYNKNNFLENCFYFNFFMIQVGSLVLLLFF